MKIKPFVAIAIASLLGGCAAVQNVNDTMTRVEATNDRALEHMKTMREAAAPARKTVEFKEEAWVAQRPIEIKRKNVPEAVNCLITFVPVAPVELLEFGQYVTRLCGLPVRVAPDALIALYGGSFTAGPAARAPGGASQLNSPVAAMNPSLPPLPSIPGQPLVGATSAGASTGVSTGRPVYITDISWRAQPLSGLLDVVTSRLGLSWKYAEGAVEIFYLDTRTFSVYAIPTSVNMESVVTSGTTTAAGISSGTSGAGGSSTSGGVSGNSGSTQTTSVKMETSLVDDLAKNIESMLTPNVGRMSMSPSTGTMTVTDTPEVLGRVEAYLKAENTNITKQVLLNVKVLAVSLLDRDSVGIDWNLVYQSMNGTYGIGLANAFQVDPSSSTASVNILDTSNSRFAGSSLLVKLLSQQGRVSTITSPSVTTLNLQPVPVQVARQTSYLASVQTTTTTDVGTTSSLTPGTVTTGFNMNLLPYVMPDSHLLLQYSINLSVLQRLRQVSSGGNTIEIPEVDNRIFSQKVRLKSGQTLVLSGFEQAVDDGTKQGVGRADFWGLGGGVAADNRRDVIVVLITPVVLD